MSPEVRTYPGVPPVGAFGATDGTPIVINTATDTPYYLKSPGDVVTPFAGGGGGTVTHTSGALTADLVLVGNGGADAKVLPASTDGFYLKQVAGIAAWAAVSAAGITRPKVQALLQIPTFS